MRALKARLRVLLAPVVGGVAESGRSGVEKFGGAAVDHGVGEIGKSLAVVAGIVAEE